MDQVDIRKEFWSKVAYFFQRWMEQVHMMAMYTHADYNIEGVDLHTYASKAHNNWSSGHRNCLIWFLSFQLHNDYIAIFWS
jgi:hypothetical protein